MLHRSLQNPPEGGGGPGSATIKMDPKTIAREMMVRSSSQIGFGGSASKVNFEVGTVAKQAKRPSFGLGADRDVGKGQGRQVAKGTKGADRHMAELLGHVAELGDWRSVVLAEKLLPLSHFTSFTVLTSKLCRAKGELSKSVGYLLRQVRCLLFDTTGDDLLARELARIKADPTNQLEERVDELTDQLDEVKVQLHQERGMNRWKVILIQVGTILEEEQQSKFRKTTKKYIVKVKDQNNPAKIVEEGEEGGEDTWGNPEVVKKKKGMIKKQAEKLEKRDQAIAKRDAKLLAERQKFTEAVMEYEKQQAEEEAELQAHIGALTAADEAHNHQVQELEKAKLQLEADNTAMHQKWFEKATLLVEKEKYADSRYPELITFEDELKAKLAALETMSKEMLFGIQSSDHAAAFAKAASESLKYAADKQLVFQAMVEMTNKLSENISAVLIPKPEFADVSCQCKLAVATTEPFVDDVPDFSHEHFSDFAQDGPREPSEKRSMKSSAVNSPYGSIKASSPKVPMMRGNLSPNPGGVRMWGSPEGTGVESLKIPSNASLSPVYTGSKANVTSKPMSEYYGEVSPSQSSPTSPILNVLKGGPSVASMKRDLKTKVNYIEPSPPFSGQHPSPTTSSMDVLSSLTLPQQISVQIPEKLTVLYEALTTCPKHRLELLERVVTDPSFLLITPDQAASMALTKKDDHIDLKIRLVEERESHCRKLEIRNEDLEMEHRAMSEKKKAAELKMSEYMAQEDDRLFQHEKRALELEKEKGALDDRERTIINRVKEADEKEELLGLEKAFFDEKISSLLGSKQGRASLSKLMSLEARERDVSRLEEQKAEFIEQEASLKHMQEEVMALKANVEKREMDVEILNGQIEAAVAEAAQEQGEFERSVEVQTTELERRKTQLDEFWNEIKDQVDVHEGRKEVLELRTKVMDREYRVKVKEEQVEKEKLELEESRKQMENKLKVLAAKAIDDAEAAARQAVRKREEEVTVREGEANRRLIDLDKQMAKSNDLASKAKSLQEIQDKLKIADSRLALADKRSMELVEIEKELDLQKKEILALSEGSDSVAVAASRFLEQEEKVKRLSAEKKEWGAKEKSLNATIQKLELIVAQLEVAQEDGDGRKVKRRGSMTNLSAASVAGSTTSVEKEKSTGGKGKARDGSGKGEKTDVSSKLAKKAKAKMAAGDDDAVEGWEGYEAPSSKPGSRGSSRMNISSNSARGRISQTSADMDVEAQRLLHTQRDLEVRERELQASMDVMRRREEERSKAILVKEKEIEKQFEALRSEQNEAAARAKKIEGEAQASIDKMVHEHEKAKRQLRVKQERLNAEVHDVESQLAHLEQLKHSEDVLESEFAAIADADVGSIEENRERQKALIQMGEITIRHLGALQEVYHEKVKLIDAEVRRRKRTQQFDVKSQLQKETITGLTQRTKSTLERMQISEHNFLVNVMLGSPDAGRPLHDSSNALHPSIVAPSPFGEAPPGGDFTLPRIGGSKPTLGGGSRAASRKGGGFRVGHAQRDKKLRQAMSAPTGLVDLLSAEERRTLTDISQAGRQLHFQAPDTPGSVSGFFHSPGGVPQSPGIAGSGLQQYVESEMRGLSDDGMEQRGAHLIVSKTKGQFFAGGVSTPELVPKSWGGGIDPGPNYLGVGSRGGDSSTPVRWRGGESVATPTGDLQVQNWKGGSRGWDVKRRGSSPAPDLVGRQPQDRGEHEASTPKKPTYFFP